MDKTWGLFLWMEMNMWDGSERFQYGDEVWSSSPVYFHGHVVGFMLLNGEKHNTWIVQSVLGTIMFVKDMHLEKAKKQEPLKVEGKVW